MVEFKVVISDPKNGKSYSKAVSGHHANSMVGKRIGDDIDGIFVGMPGFKLKITGGSDGQGFSMRGDLPGMRRKKILVSHSRGFRPEHPGVRKRRMLRGNTIGPDISQINLKVVKYGAKGIEEALAEKEA
ncbi:MAG: 30S ribosomal protein S6e [Candidatus Thermoplasmatota archaeon]|nr:30S ribosomal protein S6e [Candidatus Thermoplasmatota archaeon]